ncbi:ArsR/SmtB family transcription factor [Pseudoteredinibacter isoporae]|uniref:ArsR family transcriptional regulator n=1 Tax=Pseudoteredinibacter isoporae TaxID=570281 RepID=A0A7X0JQW7_9GAMM|nr:metalloregulator ArsR/SmtB family transcription factor [Pseudoteredinibacter isoporae]MBB6520492.1 ArsR family transcriptional regulator [Pseudoteredinibacter isoporae]NHO86059.1 metalloregulator ArsR/SmtB family transcription factor [Pseudoteredinibacter isoporae]NIB25490.1 metalloregulator ArsR/SmtB family transcription factor [Pseudoteredinibacter isoporae]
MSSPDAIADRPAEQLAALLKAAADPLRLEVLRVLARDSYGVLELVSIFDLKQSSMSHHLKVLASAGLVATRREGNSIFYRRALASHDPLLGDAQRRLFHSVDSLPLAEQLQAQLDEIQSEREAASRKFFTENAGKFREQADLIASFPIYREQVAEALLAAPLHDHKLALELGPGEGEFLPYLAERFDTVFALDNSPAMLETSRQLVQSEGLNNVELILGDTKRLAELELSAQCIVVNMVLHHTPSPAQIFSDLANSLASGGVLLVTDLCRHDQAWAQDACGDLWLGFEPQDLSQWSEAAGLEEGQSIYFALRNGFQIQIREFIKPALT